jgi:hypothetical protein
MPIDPTRIIFAAQPKRVNRFDEEDDGCRGCLFEKERASVCHVAEAEAKKRGLPSCEDNRIYIAVKIDPRQVDMFE